MAYAQNRSQSVPTYIVIYLLTTYASTYTHTRTYTYHPLSPSSWLRHRQTLNLKPSIPLWWAFQTKVTTKEVGASQTKCFHLFQTGSCSWFSLFLQCAYHACVLFWVCLHLRVWKCVITAINIDKYKQNCDDITCDIDDDDCFYYYKK